MMSRAAQSKSATMRPNTVVTSQYLRIPLAKDSRAMTTSGFRLPARRRRSCICGVSMTMKITPVRMTTIIVTTLVVSEAKDVTTDITC